MARMEGDGQQTASVVLYGGKGGVGKTTCAAAHALEISHRRPDSKTLVVSTDPAHSLSDVFEQSVGGEPTAMSDSLYAVEVDPETGQEASRVVVEALADELRDAGLRVGKEDLERLFDAGLIPGGDEVAALEYIARYTGGEYDTVVFDTAPTGHTVRLLDLPAVLSETFGVASDVQKRVRRTARVARSMVFGPVAYWDGSDDTDEITSLRGRIDAVDGLLHDPARSRFRIVLTPEQMAIAETERLVNRLDNASIPLDSLVVNRVFENSQSCSCDRCKRDAERHAARLQTIEETFDLPVRTVPQLQTEAHGLDALSEIGPTLLSRSIGHGDADTC